MNHQYFDYYSEVIIVVAVVVILLSPFSIIDKMATSNQKMNVSKAALALRAYLAKATQAELDARWARVKSLGFPKGPTVADLVSQQSVHFVAPQTGSFVGTMDLRDIPAGEYSYAMAA